MPFADLDLMDDRAAKEHSGLSYDAILWSPQSAAAINDRRSAARFVIDVVRRRADLRARYPLPLTSGTESPLLAWLQAGGVLEFGLSDDALLQIRALFSRPLGREALQILEYRDDLRAEFPLGLLPTQRSGLFEWFFSSGRAEYDLTLEEIWWFFLAAAEAPGREFVRSYGITPRWQREHPIGMTVFGRERLAAWIVEEYGVAPDAGWLQPETWPNDMTAAQQVRLAYRTTPRWSAVCPAALADRDDAEALLAWLESAASGLSDSARRWCGERRRDGTAAHMIVSGVNVLAHFRFPSGLRSSAEALCRSMETAGLSLSKRNVRTLYLDDLGDGTLEGLEVHDVTLIHAQPEPYFDDIYGQCNLVGRRPAPYRIAYWYWELDRVPESWREAAAGVDEIWAATEFVASAMRSVVDKPVHTLLPGLRLGEFKRRSRREFALPIREDGRFAFLFSFHMNSVFTRKNPLGLIQSFRKAFGRHEPVDLILKTTTHGSYDAELDIMRAAADDANVFIIDQVFDAEMNLSLVDSCDAYVSLHRSEGLGITMAEAMLLGKPVIATRYSGNQDFMNDRNSLLVDCAVKPLIDAVPPYNIPGACWAEPDIGHAASLMRRLVENEELRLEIGAKAKGDAQDIFSPVAAGQRFAQRLGEIQMSLP